MPQRTSLAKQQFKVEPSPIAEDEWSSYMWIINLLLQNLPTYCHSVGSETSGTIRFPTSVLGSKYIKVCLFYARAFSSEPAEEKRDLTLAACVSRSLSDCLSWLGLRRTSMIAHSQRSAHSVVGFDEATASLDSEAFDRIIHTILTHKPTMLESIGYARECARVLVTALGVIWRDGQGEGDASAHVDRMGQEVLALLSQEVGRPSRPASHVLFCRHGSLAEAEHTRVDGTARVSSVACGVAMMHAVEIHVEVAYSILNDSLNGKLIHLRVPWRKLAKLCDQDDKIDPWVSTSPGILEGKNGLAEHDMICNGTHGQKLPIVLLSNPYWN
ncbi:hypothetical protein EV363DRAFT_1301347 [Boletus edulis]|nr:hypothetical protein EV363DRAFT_1301347 [Boletus edulis]